MRERLIGNCREREREREREGKKERENERERKIIKREGEGMVE